MSDIHNILLGIHARARRIDRDQALLGALGVGASAYAHQIDSVHRMVTAPSCRWLMACEVGLGKTIQAIMAMRALAAQAPEPLRVALVIPDDLVAQWEEELLCRGHVLATEAGPSSVTGNLTIGLVRPSVLAKDRRIIPDKVDLLLIDEFPRLTVQARRDLAMAARTILNVILMTATPQLHIVANRSEILAILEPEAERTARAEGRDVLGVLADREAAASSRYAEGLHDATVQRSVGEAFGLYRRVIRTERSHYPDVLPRRIYQPIRVRPTDGDVERIATTRAYIAAARAEGLDLRDDVLLQVAGRSPRSLRERLSTLRRATPSLQSAWSAMDRCIREQPGDARLDALVDHVRAIAAADPETRIVIVAEDNPTTDYLQDALERLADVRVARKRRSVGAEDELEAQLASLKDALDDFISGEATVLVAADAAREGHNLQFAGEIVFFALPWSPSAVQQWIGRIDRIGATDGPRSRRITVTPIVVEGSPEARILEVLEGSGVFVSSDVIDDAEGTAIAESINRAAKGLAGASWGEAVTRAKALGGARDEWLRTTMFPPAPRTRAATRREKTLGGLPYAMPFAPQWDNASPDWFHTRELATEAMLKLAQSEHLEIRKHRDGDQRFRSMWYSSKTRALEGTVIPEIDPSGPWHRQTYIARRRDMACPPHASVAQGDGHRRRLHFLDHGDSLHDCLVETFERCAPRAAFGDEFVIDLPHAHPLLEWEGKRLLVGWAEIDFCSTFTFDPNALPSLDDQKASKPERDAWIEAVRRTASDFQADRRWLTDLCPPSFLLKTMLLEDGQATPVLAETAITAPIAGIGSRQRGKLRSPLQQDGLKSARAAMIAALVLSGDERTKMSAASVRSGTLARLFAAEADAEGRERAARAEAQAAAARDQAYDYNRAELRAAELSIRLAEAAWNIRSRRIRGAETAVSSARIKDPKLVTVVPRRHSDP